MATDRCLKFLPRDEFETMPRDDQARGLAEFLTVLFEPGTYLHLIDEVRLLECLKAYIEPGESVGETMIALLTAARAIHSREPSPRQSGR